MKPTIPLEEIRIKHSPLRLLAVRSAWLSLLIVISTGCAFTRTKVDVRLSPTASKPLNRIPTAQLFIGQVEDTRPVKDKYVLTQKFNGYGQRTSGAYVANEPVSDIFKAGLLLALQDNGFIQTSNQSSLELRANIQDFDHTVVMGFWTATVSPKLTVRFELFDISKGFSVWRDTLVGRATMETAWGTGEFLVQTFSKASDDVFLQLMSDNTFREIISNRSIQH